jgi:hypothetical protein
MSLACKCGSYAINLHRHGRDLTDTESCDVCYWRHRAEAAVEAEREACAVVCENLATSCDDPDVCAAAIRQRAGSPHRDFTVSTRVSHSFSTQES